MMGRMSNPMDEGKMEEWEMEPYRERLKEMNREMERMASEGK